MITLSGLTKRYGPKLAVDELTAQIEPGRVIGFLGPNGAGKSTTMRMIVGLDRPTRGAAMIDGQPYAALRNPVRQVGALLDPDDAHPGRTARSHLSAVSASNRIPRNRVEQVLDLVGLSDVGGQRVGTFLWACNNGSASRPLCSGTRRCCYSLNRSTGSTLTGSGGSGI